MSDPPIELGTIFAEREDDAARAGAGAAFAARILDNGGSLSAYSRNAALSTGTKVGKALPTRGVRHSRGESAEERLHHCSVLRGLRDYALAD